MDSSKLNLKLISHATKYVSEILDIPEAVCSGHDLQHSIRVYRNAIMIAESEHITDPTVSITRIGLSALLHDVDDHKLFNTYNNAHARQFLRTHRLSKTDTELIINIIKSISFSRNHGLPANTIEGKIVQDADRLDAIGAIGIARCFAYGGANGRTIADSIHHFYDKLLLLKDMMNTESGKTLAEERHKYMKDFIQQCISEEDTWNAVQRFTT